MDEATTADGAAAVEGQGTSRALALVRDHAGDVTFGAVVIFSVAYWTRITSEAYFFADDWLMLQQVDHGDYLAPYNDHLSVVILSMWRVLAEVGHGAYWPFQTTGIVVRCAVSVAVYVAVRLKLGPLIACCVATFTLWSTPFDFFPATLNHYLVLVAAAACAVLLDRGRRADLPLAIAVAFALLSAGGGVAVVAACLVHSACTRAPLRRWLVVIVPAAFWVLWFLIRSDPSSAAKGEGSLVSTVTDALIYARDLVYETGVQLIVNWAPLGIIVLVGYLAFGVWTLRGGLHRGANYLAWTAAILVWAYGLSTSRSLERIAGLGPAVDLRALQFSYRYLLTVMVFMILAVLPRKPITWPTLEARSPAFRVATVIGLTAVMLLLVSGRVIGTRSGIQDTAAVSTSYSRQTRINALLSATGPSAVPDGEPLSLAMALMTPEQVRDVMRHLGLDADITGEQFDRAMVDEGLIEAFVSAEGPRTCGPRSRNLTVPPFGVLHLWSDQPTWDVSVRAAGEDWVPLRSAHADEVMRITLPSAALEGPWEVRAEGACRVPS